MAYADTDAGGVLHHAKYLELAESSRHWWLRGRNQSFTGLSETYGISLTVRAVSARYISAIFLEDEIGVITRLANIDRSGMEWRTQFVRKEKPMCEMAVRMVCVDSKARKVIPVPDDIIVAFSLPDEVQVPDVHG